MVLENPLFNSFVRTERPIAVIHNQKLQPAGIGVDSFTVGEGQELLILLIGYAEHIPSADGSIGVFWLYGGKISVRGGSFSAFIC